MDRLAVATSRLHKEGARAPLLSAMERRTTNRPVALAAAILAAPSWEDEVAQRCVREEVLGAFERVFDPHGAHTELVRRALGRDLEALRGLADRLGVAAICDFLGPIATGDVASSDLASELGDELGATFARVIATAAQRRKEFPLEARIRVITASDRSARICTLGMTATPQQTGPAWLRAVHESVLAEKQLLEATDAKVFANLLDAPDQEIDGPSFGLAATIATRAIVSGYAIDEQLIAIGRGPIGALGDPLIYKKIEAIRAYNDRSGRPLARLAVSVAEPIETNDDPRVIRLDPREWRERQHRDVFDGGQSKLRKLRRLERATVTPAWVSANARDAFDAFIDDPTQRVLVVVGDSGSGKRTLLQQFAEHRRANCVVQPIERTESIDSAIATLGISSLPRFEAELHGIDLELLRAFVWTIDGGDDVERAVQLVTRLVAVHAELRVARQEVNARLKIVLALGPTAYARTRGQIAAQRWLVHEDLGFDQRDFQHLGVTPKPALARLCRRAIVWSYPKEIEEASTPLGLISAILDKETRDLGSAIDHMAKQRSMTFPRDLAPAVGHAVADAPGGQLQIKVDWVREHALGHALAKSFADDREELARWLALATTSPSIERAITYALVREFETTTVELASRSPGFARAIGLALVELDLRTNLDAEKIWANLVKQMRDADESCWAALLDVVGTHDDANELLGDALRHYAPSIRTIARISIQARIAALPPDASDAQLGHALQPLVARMGERGVLVPRTNPIRVWRYLWARSKHRQQALLEACLVAVTEAARRLDGDRFRFYLTSLGSHLRAVFHRGPINRFMRALVGFGLGESWGRLKRRLARIARGVIKVRLTDHFLRSHNPYAETKDTNCYFKIPIEQRKQLMPFVDVVAAKELKNEDLEALIKNTAQLHASGQFQHAVPNTIVEAAWAVIVTPERLESIIASLEQQFHASVKTNPTHAQSCLFSMFRALWQIHRQEPAMRPEVLRLQTTYRTCVHDWYAQTGGEYTMGAPARQKIVITHVFRCAALAIRVARDRGEDARAAAFEVFRPMLELRKGGSERVLDEIMHLGHEFYEWEIAAALACDLVKLPGKAALPRRIHEIVKSMAGASKRHVALWRSVEAYARGDADEPTFDPTADSGATAMFGLTLAFEETAYTLLREPEFRSIYATWLTDACTKKLGYVRWFTEMSNLGIEAVFEPGASHTP